MRRDFRTRPRVVRQALITAVLVGLVAVFAVLQYRWLGQVSEADRAEMRRSVAERARQFAADFDREVSAAYALLGVPGSIDEASTALRVAERFDHWRTDARFPAVVRNLYAFNDAAEDGQSLYRFVPESKTFQPMEWPAQLEPVRARFANVRMRLVALEPRDGRTASTPPSVPFTQVVADVPAVVIPPSAPGTPYTVIELDRDVLTGDLLASLVEQHFAPRDSQPYRVTVLDRNAQNVFSSNAGAVDIRPESADATASLFQLRADVLTRNIFSVQFDGQRPSESMAVVLRSAVSRLEVEAKTPIVAAGGIDRPAVAPIALERGGQLGAVTGVRTLPGVWTLLLQHPAGSIDAAVTSARRRNLWVSFGVLTILAAGVALIVVNARRAEQLAAQQLDFVATVSHELRTPVAVMRAAAQNLSAGVIPAEGAKKYGELIETEGRRLTEMVDQVLEFASLSGNPRESAAQPFAPADVASHALESCRMLIESGGITAHFDVTNDGRPIPIVFGDPDALRRAIGNLILNAQKYGADGRWVGITVRSAAHRGKDEVQIAVSDRGRGIDPADLPHLFEPFFRGQEAIARQIQGSGLGLTLVKRIADAHGGRVTVESTPGSGATFTIHLPATRADADAGAKAPAYVRSDAPARIQQA